MRKLGLQRAVFVPSPGPGIGVLGCSYYVRATGTELLSVHTFIRRSDTAEDQVVRHSGDNGHTWSAPTRTVIHRQTPQGVWRRAPKAGYVDPVSGRYLSVWNEAILPNDDPLEGLKQWRLFYSVSEDGGRSELVSGQIIHAGAEFNAEHPLPGMWVGRNSVMLGDYTCTPLTLGDGTLLVPCQITPLGPDGSYYNPGGGYTYHYAVALIGRWREDGSIAWSMSAPAEGDPARSTRGMIEPTLAQLDDGRILMIMRGSNDSKGLLPGYRWASWSEDRGRTWSAPVPWTYADGSAFFSPSSCSQLIRHTGGRLFWAGNLTPENPRANRPRYPFVLGEVDRCSGLLIRDTVAVVDDRQPDESPHLTLSNFYMREDRESGELILHLTRLFAHQLEGQPLDWTADALQYRITV